MGLDMKFADRETFEAYYKTPEGLQEFLRYEYGQLHVTRSFENFNRKTVLNPKRQIYTIAGTDWMFTNLVWAVAYGEVPSEIIEHVDLDILNNELSNLRLYTSRKTCPFEGVDWHPLKKRWQADIRVGKVLLTLGWFTSPFLAKQAIVDARRQVLHVGVNT